MTPKTEARLARVAELRESGELTNRQIADDLGMSLSALKRMVQRSRLPKRATKVKPQPKAPMKNLVACPCCGGAIEALNVHDLLDLFSNGKRRILEALPPGRKRTIAQIIDHLYALDPDGGPENAARYVRVQLHQIRKKLIGTGWAIAGVTGQGNSGYTLVMEKTGEA